MIVRKSGATIERVAAQAEGKGHSGPTAALVLCDEFHEHESDAMLNRYTAAFKSVRQPLALILTNAGSGMETPCGVEHEYGAAVLEGAKEGDSYFPFIAGVDEGDKPFEDEAVWPKGNPSFRHGLPSLAYYREQVGKHKGSASGQATMERLLFGRWTETVAPWLTRETWESVTVDALSPEEDRRRARFIFGLDLAQKWDVCAGTKLWCFGDRAELATVAWCPTENIQQRTDLDKLPYQDWVDAGHMRGVPGKVISYAWVAEWIADAWKSSRLLAVVMDPHHRTFLFERLRELGVRITEDLSRLRPTRATQGRTLDRVPPAGNPGAEGDPGR